ncbi:MAG TPA: hypothetical protein PKV16_07570 [Caldisericia bacterium]|nr:hypothetical protein [Caldisericia bacterium]HPF49457.1 hypothetical protein [Caldisericia bacterium]HPI84675.1 hypothetical protein [Caldisericia bacterium]HPQ93626.1 hypothetical protein [Caldisericia bacterium]HRV75597.1 hypothetical protein [Caldisericia bacterium]
MGNEKPKVTVNVLYLYCDSANEMRHFYKDLVGLGEHDFGVSSIYCGQTSDGLSMMWVESENGVAPKPGEWANTLGFEGGKSEEPSWGIQISMDEFKDTVKRLTDGGVKTLFPKPIWCQDSYWAFPVMDPMGYTVEVYAVPKEKPESKDWSD